METVWVIALIALLIVVLPAILFTVFFRKAAKTVDKAAQKLRALIPDSAYVEVDGTKIHYVQAGKGEDIVLIHGIGASVYMWRFIFPFLETKYRVTAIDLPGFGKSSKEAKRDYGLDAQTEIVVRALEKIGIKEASLIGSSMGGAVSLWLAKLYPERFKKLAVLAPATDSRLVPLPIYHFATAAPFFRKAVNRRTMKLILGRVLARRDLITDEVVDSYLEPFKDKGESVRAFWSAMTLLSDKRLPSQIQGIAAKVLVIYGEKDLMVPRRSIQKLMKQLEDAKLVTHPDGGHHIQEDEPEWTAQVLIDYFKA